MEKKLSQEFRQHKTNEYIETMMFLKMEKNQLSPLKKPTLATDLVLSSYLVKQFANTTLVDFFKDENFLFILRKIINHPDNKKNLFEVLNSIVILTKIYKKKPLSIKVYDRINTFTLEVRLDYLGEKCIFCVKTFSKGEVLNELPCNHTFHVLCIKNWFEEYRICPVCQKNVKKGFAKEFKKDKKQEEHDADSFVASFDDLSISKKKCTKNIFIEEDCIIKKKIQF